MFRQQRLGHEGRPFHLIKFRTMRPLDPGVDIRSLHDPANARLLKTADDPRITPVGRILRRTSIDELPQLINVLAGDMSLVGPRPLLDFMLTPYPELSVARHTMRPGITGLWQISARTGSDSALCMAEPDLSYLEHFSIWLDLGILVLTVPACIRGTGAV
jgi:lipopolysaccharide/colanic/teichoic acid biosynthesis glycosyltransferase